MSSKKLLLKNFVALPGIYFFLLRKILLQKRFLKATVGKELSAFKNKNDGSLTPVHFKKITRYYALGVPGILGEACCVLRGKAMSREERLCITYLGGISGLLDDLFDDPRKDESRLKKFILEPEKLVPADTYEELLIYFYRRGLHFSPDPEELKKRALRVFETQQESKKQNYPGLTSEEIKTLTRDKGGTSFLFYRLCLEHPLTASEEKFHFNLGGLMQLGNDIFDVWEDRQARINTTATISTDIRELRNQFVCEMEKSFQALEGTHFEKKNKIRYLQILTLAHSRVFVCLDQFEKLKAFSNDTFSPEKYSRKQLICDMQKPKNQLQAINYFLSFEISSFFA